MKHIPTLPPPQEPSVTHHVSHVEPPLPGSANAQVRQPTSQQTPFVKRQPVPTLTRPSIDRRTSTLIAAFRYAFAGVWYLISTQRNAQIHLLIGACALALAATLRVERWEWLALVLTIALVLAAEGVNTAVEAAVDVATNRYHPLAAVAKDTAAGAVLLCAFAAVIAGCIIFLPHLWPMVTWLITRMFAL